MLFMDEGTDITSLTPVITLAPGAKIKAIETSAPGVTISPDHKGVIDFSHQVDYIVIAADGSIVKYKFLATAEGKTRGVDVGMYLDPASGVGGYTNPFGNQYNVDYISAYAYPYSPYTFDKWLVTVHVPNQINLPSSHFGNSLYINPLSYDTDILTVFQLPSQYTVSVESENTNKGTVSGGGSCNPGGYVSISATPKSGYVFDGWYRYGLKESTDPNTNYYPSSSCTLTAKFKARYTVTLQSEDTNKGTVSSNESCNEGESVPISAYPKPGWAFEGWYLNGLKISSSQNTFYQPSSTCTLIAKFVELYTVTVQSEDTNRGTVSGGGTCSSGSSVPVSASPKSGYTFEGWYLSGSRISTSASFNYFPSASCTLIAKFNMAGSISGNSIVCVGSSASFTGSASGSFSWDKSSNLSQSGSGSTVSFSGISNGAGWVSIKDNLNGNTIAIKNVWVGTPPSISLSGPSSVPTYSGASFYANPTTNGGELGITSYEWTMSPVYPSNSL